MSEGNKMHGTTIVAIKKDGFISIAGDGQVSIGGTIFKNTAKKIRKIYKDEVIIGFAGSTADAFTLAERLEKKLEAYQGQLLRAAIELAKDWRGDKYLRHLEAMLIAISCDNLLVVSGNGDVIEPDDGIAAIGSGGLYALSAAKSLANSSHTSEEIARRSLEIAAEICVYTNNNIVLETLKSEGNTESPKESTRRKSKGKK